jgi:hypothetical protein
MKEGVEMFPFLHPTEDEGIVLLCNQLSLGQLELARASFFSAASQHAQKAFAVVEHVVRFGPHRSWLASGSARASASVRWFAIALLREAYRNGLRPDGSVPDEVICEVEVELLLYDCFNETARDPMLYSAYSELRRQLADLRRPASARPAAAALGEQDAASVALSAWSVSSSLAGSSSSSSSSSHGSTSSTLSSSTLAELRGVLLDSPVLGRILCDRLYDHRRPHSAGNREVQRLVAEMVQLLLDEDQLPEALRLAQSLHFSQETEAIVGADRVIGRLAAALVSPETESVAASPRRHFEHAVQSLWRVDNSYPLTLLIRCLRDRAASQPSSESLFSPLGSVGGGARGGSIVGAVDLFASDLFNVAYCKDTFFLDLVTEFARSKISQGDFSSLTALCGAFPRLRSLFFMLAWSGAGDDIALRKRATDSFERRGGFSTGGDDSPILRQRVQRLQFLLKSSWWWCGKLIEIVSTGGSPRIGDQAVEDFGGNGHALASHILRALQMHSLPYVVRSALSLVELADVVHMLALDPVSPAVLPGYSTVDVDTDFVRSYVAACRLLDVLAASSEDSARASCDAMVACVEAMRELRSVAVVVETLFKLVFVRSAVGRYSATAAAVDCVPAALLKLSVGRLAVVTDDKPPVFLSLHAQFEQYLARVGCAADVPKWSLRLSALVSRISILAYRHALVRVSSGGLRSGREQWLDLVVASPRTHVIRLMRGRRYDLVDEFLRIFSTSVPEVTAGRMFHEALLASHREPPEQLSAAIQPLLRQLDRVGSFCVLLDILLSVATSPATANVLLDKTRELLQRLRDLSPAEVPAGAVLAQPRSLAALDSVLRAVEGLLSSGASVSASATSNEQAGAWVWVLGGGCNFGIHEAPEDLRARLTMAHAVWSVYVDLAAQLLDFETGSTRADGLNEAIWAARRRLVAEGLAPRGRGGAQDGSTASVVSVTAGSLFTAQLVESFLTYLVQLGDVLKPVSIGSGLALVDNLRISPELHLAQLVFVEHDFERCARLASLMHADLARFVLSALETPAQFPLAISRNVVASLPIARYLARRSKVLSILAALLGCPVDHVPARFVWYAAAEAMPLPLLHNWMMLFQSAADLLFSATLSPNSLAALRGPVRPRVPAAAATASGSPASLLTSSLLVTAGASGSERGGVVAAVPGASAASSFSTNAVDAAPELGSSSAVSSSLAIPASRARREGTSVADSASSLSFMMSPPSSAAMPMSMQTQMRRPFGGSETGADVGATYSFRSSRASNALPSSSGSLASSLSGPAVGGGSSAIAAGVSFAADDDGPGPESPEELRDLFRLLQDGSSCALHDMYSSLVERLLAHGRVADAVDTAERHLVRGAPDAVLQAVICSPSADKSTVWRYVLRLHDAELATAYVFQFRASWDPQVCLDMLGKSLSRLPSGSPLLSRCEELHARMQVYMQILEVPHCRWKSWQSIEGDCSESAEAVVRALINQYQQWDLARRVADLWGAEGIRLEIEEALLLHLLSKNDTTSVLQALRRLRVDEVVRLVENVLNEVPQFRTKRFLVQYVISTYGHNLAADALDRLSAKERGIRLCMLLSADLQGVYYPLLDKPHLIVESLIMSRHVEIVGMVLRRLPELRDDELLVRYAERALDVVGPQDSNQFAPDHWLLTGDIGNDDETRSMHFFPATPCARLAKELLYLCGDSALAGRACLQLCDGLSKALIGDCVDGREQALALILEMVKFAKLLFSRDGDHGDDVSLCEEELEHLEVLEHIIEAKGSLSGCSLLDLRDKQKVFALCDRLIEDDRMQLASELAKKCGVPADMILGELALSLLDLGLYAEAKAELPECA